MFVMVFIGFRGLCLQRFCVCLCFLLFSKFLFVCGGFYCFSGSCLSSTKRPGSIFIEFCVSLWSFESLLLSYLT